MADTITVSDMPLSLTQTPWDYHVATVHARHNDVLEAELKARGRDGWQLVFMHMPMANEYQCIFKRSAA
jgi:hypothetical protein